MLYQIIHLIIWVLVFLVAAYAAKWVCEEFKMPPPVFWLFGAFLLVIILYFIGDQFGTQHWPVWKKP